MSILTPEKLYLDVNTGEISGGERLLNIYDLANFPDKIQKEIVKGMLPILPSRFGYVSESLRIQHPKMEELINKIVFRFLEPNIKLSGFFVFNTADKLCFFSFDSHDFEFIELSSLNWIDNLLEMFAMDNGEVDYDSLSIHINLAAGITPAQIARMDVILENRFIDKEEQSKSAKIM